MTQNGKRVSVAYRPATLSDVPVILRLIRSEKTYLLYRPKKEIIAHIGNFLVADAAGDTVGCASFENYSPEIAEIRSLVVLPAFRGQGIARRLVRLLMRRKLRHQKVFVVTSKVDYFTRLGFHNVLKEKYVMFKR
ncbi:GNAT family N-acetyltransferase [Patescibacteria group bacterium]|nr:GNAT family N-acetyltransferase [Patescibacteria group bacterium]